MPHEKIHRTVPVYGQVPVPWTGTTGSPDPDPRYVTTVPGEVGERTELVQVTWEPDRHVQLGIDLGKEFAFTADTDAAVGPEDEIPVFTALWFDLSRPEINRLIKALRRARDAAYGRDE